MICYNRTHPTILAHSIIHVYDVCSEEKKLFPFDALLFKVFLFVEREKKRKISKISKLKGQKFQQYEGKIIGQCNCSNELDKNIHL